MLRTLPIRTLLRGATVLALVAMVAIGGFGLFGMLQSDRGLNHQLDATQAMRSSMTMDMLHDGIRGDAYYLLYLSTDPTPAKLAAATADMEASFATLRGALEEMSALPLPDRTRASLEVARPAIENYIAAATALGTAAGTSQEAALTAMEPMTWPSTNWPWRLRRCPARSRPMAIRPPKRRWG